MITQILRRHAGVRQAFRHFPLVSIHDLAKLAAETAEFAAHRGGFWPMHKALMAQSARLSIPLLLRLASERGLSPDALQDALFSGRFAAKVGHDFARGMLKSVDGTPTLFINGKRYVGPMTIGALGAAVDAARGSTIPVKPRLRVVA
ncbi:protein-disulfide isomerase [Sphingomonas japonica]|uniref:Protein-disulfide isomerase n=1 Tax=Sphingomonas japonica TaxID=511662 RepID=A0ABX0U028_9SPHN|nr:protein-disulfide isomerase [Sphingomonas japonica]